MVGSTHSGTYVVPRDATCTVEGDWWIRCLPRVPENRKCLKTLVRKTVAGSMPASVSARSSSLPAGPTKGLADPVLLVARLFADLTAVRRSGGSPARR